MSDSFGARLRQQRERQQITLAFIAEETKISLSLLEALERDDLTHWPTGLFRRGFVRDYARVIGLDCDAVVREFLQRYPDPIEESAPAPPASDSVPAKPPTRLHALVGSAVDALRRLHIRPDPNPTEDTRPGSPPRLDNAPPAEKSPTETARIISRSPLEKPDRRAGTRQPLRPSAAGRGAKPTVLRVRDGRSALASDSDLMQAAQLCTDLGRIVETSELDPLLERAAAILGAAGLIIWVLDPGANCLLPVFVHGYTDDLRARLPSVRSEADNPMAAAFRSAQPRIVASANQATGAVVVPLMAPAGCRGVLSIELAHGREQKESVLALATIFAAQLATLVGAASVVEAVNI